MPKQFLKLFNDESLFQKTLKRNRGLCNSFLIITNEDQYFLAYDQMEEINTAINAKFFLEELAKNTAAAIAFAAFDSDEDDILFVTPSDHLIKNEKKYIEAVKKAKKTAEEDYLVTFGIKPTAPHTGYGYIECKEKQTAYDVINFHEKPDLKTAKEYLSLSNFFWNSGMFMFKAGVYLEELQKYAPKVYEEVLKSYNKKQIVGENLIRLKEMNEIPDISIDYAVMEKSDKIKLIPGEFTWNDVGSFDSLIDEINETEAIETESKNNFYYSDTKKVIASIGLEDFIVIDTKDALLIVKKGLTQKVKEVVNKLKNTAYSHILYSQSVVHRPWGTYETLVDENGYKIKRIIVRPGKRLSLQKHFHRSEHWVVVSGTAEVQVGDKKYLVRPNESTYIKAGEVHRLSNPGKIPVVLIEAQVGEYTGEDDIIRIEDDFKRC
jgi:mannose-1-phosphate guanylyltransferase